MDSQQIIRDFLDAMSSAGYGGATDIIADGKIHRFTVDGDKRNSDAGWYILHIDEFPAGQFGSWKTGEKHTWTAKIERKLTVLEREALERRMTEQRAVREAEQNKIWTEAAGEAQRIFNVATSETHAYLERKAIKHYGTRTYKDAIVVPLRNQDGKLTSLQFIYEDGSKKLLTGGRVDGSYHVIAKSKPTDETPILICEGYATGASIHSATDLPVVIALNTSNLSSVAEIIRAKFPKNTILFCADNDQWTHKPIENPGVHYATKAAEEINARVCYPTFKDTRAHPTDFNDLACQEGLIVVKEKIDQALETIKPEAVSLPAENSTAFSFIHVIGDWKYTTGRDAKPVTNIENVKLLFERNKINIQYDIIRKDLRVTIPNEFYLIDTEKNDKMTRLVSIGVTAGLKHGLIPDCVAHIASQNPYNPVAEWVLSKPWDCVSRLESLFNTVRGVEDHISESKQFKETIIKRWLISAIAGAFRPNGVVAKGVLVFTGKQSVGKTSWFKRLVPQDLALTRDGMLLDPKDKDSVYQVVSNWLVELGEVDATFRKADIAQLKAFITKDKDTVRLPYARSPASFARRTVFFASVNDKDYLSDHTGNSRFWTIECDSIDYKHEIDMQQVWAEVYELFKAGESWYLTEDEERRLNVHNSKYESLTPIEELLTTGYEWDHAQVVYSTRKLSASEIARELGFKSFTQKETKGVARALKRLGVKATSSKGLTLYEIPSLKNTFNPNEN